MKGSVFASTLLAAVLGAACSNLLHGGTSPTPTSPTQITTGQWTSVSSTTTLTNICTDFHWAITEVSGANVSGAFEAKCDGNMTVIGTAKGTVSGTTVTWTAEATGTTPTSGTCPVSLSGTATFDGTQIRIPYTGTTCLGPVSGTEILRKN